MTPPAAVPRLFRLLPRLSRLLPAARGRRAPWAARAGPEQAAGTLKDDHIALGLGTRAPRHLTTTVGGEPVELKPGKGRLSRSSYRMDVTYAGRSYRRQPDSIPGSRFTRDRARPGDFSSDGDGLVIAEWREGTGAEPADAAVAYAPAAAFGTGAQPLWTTAVDAVAAAVP